MRENKENTRTKMHFKICSSQNIIRLFFSLSFFPSSIALLLAALFVFYTFFCLLSSFDRSENVLLSFLTNVDNNVHSLIERIVIVVCFCQYFCFILFSFLSEKKKQNFFHFCITKVKCYFIETFYDFFCALCM